MRHGTQGWCTGTTQRDGMERKVGGGSGWGTHVHPWLIHVSVWQKPLQYCKVISLQLKYINQLKNKLIGENWHLYDTQCSNPGLSSTSSLICILTFFSVLFYNLQWSNLQTFSQTHFLIKFLKYLYINIRIYQPMQGTQVQFPVREDPTCQGTAKPVRHNYWAHLPQAHALQREKPLQ